jgi:hypothetical protein
VTAGDLAEPGYGRILGEKVVLFTAVGRGQDRLADCWASPPFSVRWEWSSLPRPSSPERRGSGPTAYVRDGDF